MSVADRVPLDRNFLAAFCQRHRVRRLSLFGSVLRQDYNPDTSDVDVLVEFQPDAKASLFEIGGMTVELQQALGRRVDLRTPAELSRYFRDQVLNEAEPIYEAA